MKRHDEFQGNAGTLNALGMQFVRYSVALVVFLWCI